MNAKRGSNDMKNTKEVKGKTNWTKLAAKPDTAIVANRTAPRTTADDWVQAIAHTGLPLPTKKEQIALRVDADVIEWFRAQGSGWQTRMNAVLKAYSKAAQSRS